MSSQTRISTKKSSSLPPSASFKAPPVIQPKAEKKPDAKLPEWKPGGTGATNPVQRLLDSKAVQAKLTIGQPGDRYEQEADRVARDVVQRINSPVSETPQQDTVQRETEPEAEQLQMKPMLQKVHAVGGEDASQDLESSINRARGSGQPLDTGLQRSMGQAMGADFSGVRVHTDAQSDQLNQSIQAKAFTTGQDVFFRSGEYNPGSKAGQELIAHELTHVVQQNSGNIVQRKGGDDKPAKLHIHADLDAPGMGLIDQLNSGEVGHAWISLEWKDPSSVPMDIHGDHRGFLRVGGVQADPMGFWPKMFKDFDPLRQQWSDLPDDERVGYSSNPFNSYVPGQMLHPDNIHSAKATQSYHITREQADAVINYAESKRNAKYSVFFYNCTTFAKEAAKAGGQSPPSMGTGGICYPDALYKSIVKNQQNKVGTTSVADEAGTMNTVEGEEPQKKK